MGRIVSHLATGKGIADSGRYVKPRQDNLGTGARIGAALTGQQSLPTGRSLFVVDLPAGDWILWSVTGYVNDGLGTSNSSTSYMAEGTLAAKAEPGKAAYLGEFEINGDVGDDLKLVELPRRSTSRALTSRAFKTFRSNYRTSSSTGAASSASDGRSC